MSFSNDKSEKTASFNIIEWKDSSIQKEKKLSKKKRKLCRLLGIPVPPRRLYECAKIKIDVNNLLCVGDSILMNIQPEPEAFQITNVPDENGYYPIASINPLWFSVAYTGPAFIVYHAFMERR